jgi:hypothetical protein
MTLAQLIFALLIPVSRYFAIRCARRRPRSELAQKLAPRGTWMIDFVYKGHHVAAVWHEPRDATEAIRRAVDTIVKIEQEEKERVG